MANDIKRSDMVCTKVTEQMLLDLNRLAAREERKLSDFIYRYLRQRLYGDADRLDVESRSTNDDKVDHEDE